MTDLTTASAIVSGASSGIGEATVHRLASEGTDVALLARSEDTLTAIADAVREEYGVEAIVVPTDVQQSEQVAAAVEQAVEAFGGLDIAIANAGVGLGGDVAAMTDEQYQTMQRTNVDGTFFLVRETLPHLIESGGNLIAVGSFAGQYPRPANPVYAATKWWTRGFVHSVGAQVGDEDVGVTVVNPTEVRTSFDSEEGEAFEERYEPGEVTEPEEIADAIAFAAGQTNSTAQEIDLYRRDKLSEF